MKNKPDKIKLLFADDKGNIYDHPYLEMVGFLQYKPTFVESEDLILLPKYSKIFYLPGATPIGYNPETKEFEKLEKFKIGKKEINCNAVSAFIRPGFARLFLPAADYSKLKTILPLWAYSAVGFYEGKYFVPAIKIEDNFRWNPKNFDDRKLLPYVEEIINKKKNNPLVIHLKRCATKYHCFAAKNFFLGRWEAPLPVSRGCNSRCLGCISLQPKNSCPASHERINFTPSVENILDIAIPHLENAKDAIVSFGQGCEGEPLTESSLIEESIIKMRKATSKGTINLNTNGSMPEKVERLCKAGLDSIRISLSSARKELYNRYYMPINYKFEDVIESIKISKYYGLYTMINYLIFPGINDQRSEIDELIKIIRYTNVNLIHLKNLNIDPKLYIEKMDVKDEEGIGIKKMMQILKNEFPSLEFGYFNRCIKKE